MAGRDMPLGARPGSRSTLHRGTGARHLGSRSAVALPARTGAPSPGREYSEQADAKHRDAKVVAVPLPVRTLAHAELGLPRGAGIVVHRKDGADGQARDAG